MTPRDAGPDDPTLTPIQRRMRYCADGHGHDWVYTPESRGAGPYAKHCTKCRTYKGANHPDPDLNGGPIPI